MRRIEQAAESRSAESEPNWSGYLSSHPLTAERIQPFEKGTN
jgi:predicted Zn-dependent protease